MLCLRLRGIVTFPAWTRIELRRDVPLDGRPARRTLIYVCSPHLRYALTVQRMATPEEKPLVLARRVFRHWIRANRTRVLAVRIAPRISKALDADVAVSQRRILRPRSASWYVHGRRVRDDGHRNSLLARRRLHHRARAQRVPATEHTEQSLELAASWRAFSLAFRVVGLEEGPYARVRRRAPHRSTRVI